MRSMSCEPHDRCRVATHLSDISLCKAMLRMTDNLRAPNTFWPSSKSSSIIYAIMEPELRYIFYASLCKAIQSPSHSFFPGIHVHKQITIMAAIMEDKRRINVRLFINPQLFFFIWVLHNSRFGVCISLKWASVRLISVSGQWPNIPCLLPTLDIVPISNKWTLLW